MARFSSGKAMLTRTRVSFLFVFTLCPALTFAQIASDRKVLITIDRKSCFGSCPVYSAQIFTDGSVVYKGEAFVKVEGERTHKIGEVLLKKLVKAFQEIDYFSLKDEY
jgi:hypothetical protein